jgi:phage terminase large subunit-like protein
MGNDLERIATEHSVEYLLDVEAELGRRDLFYFTTEILRVQDDSPFVRPRSEIEPICIWLAKPKPDWVSGQSRWKRFLALPRGTAKTTLVSAYVAWRIVRNPNIAVYYTSEEKALALDISETISQMLTSERVEAIYGKFQGERNWQKGKYVIAQRTARRKDPTLMAGGVDVSAQGRHPDLIIADDLQGKTNVKPDGIEKVKEYLRLIWPVLNPGGELVYICTRWDYADCAADILKQRSIDPTSWDAPGNRGYFGATAQVGDEEFFPHAVPGKPLFPSILDEATQSELKLSMNIYHYYCQYENEPIPSETQYFRQEDFQYVEAYDPLDPLFQGITFYIGVDPAGGVDTTKRGDDTAIVVVGVKGTRSHRQHFVVDVAGGQLKPSEIHMEICRLYDQWRPRRVSIETSGPGKQYWANLKEWLYQEVRYLPLQEVTRGGTRESKADRIGRLEPLYRSHSVWHLKHVTNSKLEEQLLRFAPGGAVHDDYPDALSTALEAVKEGHMKQAQRTQPSYKPRYPSMGY